MAWLTEPWLARVLPEGHAQVWMRDFDIIPGFQYPVVAFGAPLIRERPGVGERFMAAYLGGVGRFLEGKTAVNIETISGHTYLQPDLVHRVTAIRPVEQTNLPSVLDFQRCAFRRGLLDRKLRPNEMCEPRFLGRAGR